MLKPAGEDFVKRYRLEYNLEALELVRKDIGDTSYSRLKALIEYRLTGKEFDRSPTEVKVALAFSAGSDSTATLEILRWASFDVVPVTVKLPQMGEKAIEKARSYGAVFIEVPEYLDVIRPQIEKGAPICGRCHSLVMDAVEEYARENGIKIVASGDMLSSGLISIYRKDDLVILNLPAFLALDKAEIIEIIGGDYDLKFGCPLLWELFRKAPSTKRLSIQRVLRETRARALTPEMAKKLILDILSR
ncbi:ATPase [Thermococcus stetteri]|uniref:ATPase n=1 Tax=Thermococcus stetteri TaxID=49900 RepID=UPI001AE22426|nr:ATPase [Thermococcus stetteri]MBP1911712.1 putative PP-loop superfamily ATPase [Thermococcus stetteri]